MQDGDYPKSILFIVLYVLGITVVLREIQDNGKIVFWSGGGGGDKVHYRKSEKK